ncbi:LLM class flavin-dependent oxidoreductase [Promicromonospora sp. NPDC090134]|uniref:LLM class flavin-dependent oxidoreductase n=1 Tax=Promicromonospora sp. NPDC090134 TaxID=3364408 RepID=UPI003816709C
MLHRPVTFGSFITPAASDPRRVVDLAVLAEDVGLDLVTFQDHPYQPAFLDSWTLLSFVAARTSTVELSANVTNLPLRPPAMIARATASLDLLTEGRIALALGSGAFWDAIAAMGGPRRTNGEAVTALDEAITVIRELWDTTRPDGARFHGDHYLLDGAKRGPRPAHPVPLWLGAYGPRTLRLVGTRADGWLPSVGYLGGIDALDAAQRRIDNAATEAGREPSAIRRMLNIGADLAEERQLTALAIEHGIDTFVLMSDDPFQIKRFGEETAPAVREHLTNA